jgi:hypothetical protein
MRSINSGGPDAVGESLAVRSRVAGILNRLQGGVEFGQLGVVGTGDGNAGLGQLVQSSSRGSSRAAARRDNG